MHRHDPLMRSLLSQFRTPTAPRRAVGFFRSGHPSGYPAGLITQSIGLARFIVPTLSTVQTIIWFPFICFAVRPSLVQSYVQNTAKLISSGDKFSPCNHLHFSLCTGLPQAIAPIVCVDVFQFSVSVVCVDGRKGWHNKTSQSDRLSDQPSGVT